MSKILLLIAIASFTAFAQITITSGDVLNMFADGKYITMYENTMQTTVDIGSPGGGNNWDFTALQFDLTINSEGVNSATSPFISDFPGANICTYRSDNFEGEQAELWSYSTINSNWDNLGNAITINSQPGTVIEIKNNPPAREAEFPFTNNSSWSQTYTQTTEINGTPISTTNVSTNSTVDAYGTMTLPGGASFEALRIRISETSGAETYVDYVFFSKSGATVNVYSSDVNLPNSGTINVDGTSYNGVPTTTGVEQISVSPDNYNLRQNYPNPFNPSTNIEYSIPEGSFVQLKVYDILGNEVATLVSQEQNAGVYRADFSGNGLASGLYIARITAGNYTNSIKMTLMK